MSINTIFWPKCPIPDCPYRVCLWAETGRCYPHSEELIGKEELDKRFAKSHPELTPWADEIN